MAEAAGNFYARIATVAARSGDRDCWIEPGRSTLSWAEVDAGAARAAAALRGCGVLPGDRVVVQVEKSAAALLLYLGCLRAGAVFVPLNTAYTDAELGYFVADAEPRLIVCDPARAAGIGAIAAAAGGIALLTLDAHGQGSWSALPGSAPPDAAGGAIEPRSGEQPAAIVYTSGTTGRSKGAMISHRNLAANARALIDTWRIGADDVLLHVLPTYHVHGLFVALHASMLAGATTLLLPRFDADGVLAALPRATVFMGVPTHYTRLLADARFTRAAAAPLRLWICGSAPLLPSTFAAFERRTGQRILERYGMSECGIIASNPRDGERTAGTVGYLLPGFDGRVVDGDGRELQRGAAGMLEVRGASVFGGYWRRPELNSSEFRADGHFITGDLATMAEDGRIAIVGRARDLIISGGFNVYPKEIELEIDAIEGVAESAVIGVPHPDFGEAVVAVVARLAGASLGEREIVEWLARRLARFKLPKRVLFVDELPRNAMAKVQKAALRERYSKTFVSAS
jgi:malonyl-CoA/methylmalonyl-CoA synthetase